MPTLEQRVRESAMHYLSPGVAAYAAMSVQELQQFIAGSYIPTDQQLQALARRMHLL